MQSSSRELAQLSEKLSSFLADSYCLYVKTHNFHWNVTGPDFHGLHIMLEEQYQDLAEAVDVVAERIRALGFLAPGSFKQFLELTSIEEAVGGETTHQMLESLLKSQKTVVETAYEVLQAAEGANDQPTVDLMTRRIEQHEKNAWMLRSTLQA